MDLHVQSLCYIAFVQAQECFQNHPTHERESRPGTQAKDACNHLALSFSLTAPDMSSCK